MKWLRKLFGTDFPDPVVGQVWRSQHSGRCIRISEVEVHDSGCVFVYVQHELTEPWKRMIKSEDGFNGLGTCYAVGLHNWRFALKEEGRVLVSSSVPKPGPWPAPPANPFPQADAQRKSASHVPPRPIPQPNRVPAIPTVAVTRPPAMNSFNAAEAPRRAADDTGGTVLAAGMILASMAHSEPPACTRDPEPAFTSGLGGDFGGGGASSDWSSSPSQDSSSSYGSDSSSSSSSID